MTTRFLARCTRLLGAQCTRVPAIQGRPLALPPPSEPLWIVAWRLPSLGPLRALCDGHGVAAAEESYPKAPERTELDQLLEQARSPQELLQLWAERGGKANQAAIAVVHLARLAGDRQAAQGGEKGGSDTDDLLYDSRFQDLLHTVNSQVSTVWNGSLVSLLRALSRLGVAPGAPVLRSLQTEAHWRLRRFSYRQLAALAEWCSVRQHSGQEGALLRDVLKQLELRWTEISDPRTLSLLMMKVGHLSASLMDRLEDKALELAERFGPEETRRVAVSLAAQGRRSVPLLRALSYHLLQKPGLELRTPLLIDLAFSYGKLNFQQTQVFQRIAGDLLPRLPEMSPGDVASCAKSFSLLKWLHLPLFESFTENFLQCSENYSTTQLCNLLMAFARLNFQPSKDVAFYSKVHAGLEGALTQLEPFLQTDVVWSLCILQQARPQDLRPVLEPGFQSRLTGGSPSRTQNYRLKLAHIVATAQLEYGELLGTPPPAPPAEASRSQPTPLQSSLHEALRSLVAGQEGTYRTAVSTVYGWTIDGELVLDSENKPMNLETLKAPHLPGAGGPTPLPNGARRIAFLAGEFPNYGSRSKDLLGRFVMQRRHLQLAGFLTVEVPYYEWLELKSDWQRVAYLKDKMGKAVAEDMAK
ncbi:FAST kinase domain-containing protein 4 [Lepisosteus oculatus]|uniref:FAST kinase domain-containing protein 4 n=1 Tax=Lepisosteus oculatus TaxID=7918 RepID=UPI0035F50C5E